MLLWTGIAIRVRGVMMPGADGRDYTAVLIERGETAEYRRTRMIARWGMSHREAEVLGYIAQGKTGPEIAILLDISHDTVRRHTASIFQKLGVETRTAAASMAADLALETEAV
jgi:DNA-binding CsgD family transcriptional regulator